MNETRVVIIGYGNIGEYALEAVLAVLDTELSGVVRRDAEGSVPKELADIKVVQDMSKLGPVDIALLYTPTRSMQEYAQTSPAMDIHMVDSFDIHTSIPELQTVLDQEAKESGRAAIPSVRWDPGSDSVVCALMQVCAPKGITYTNFGPGMSMSHTIVAKAAKGVEGALSMTIPLGTGAHRQMVYVQSGDGADLVQITTAIRSDDYFAHDEIHVIQVSDISVIIDEGHGVRVEGRGISGETDDQRSKSRMEINNPALTSQIMVACARVAIRQQPGAYTMIEILMADLLPDSCEDAIAASV